MFGQPALPFLCCSEN